MSRPPDLTAMAPERPAAAVLAGVDGWWKRHAATVLQVALPLLAVYAALKLGDEFRRLVWEPGSTGAIDLRLLHREIHEWLSGTRRLIAYPVASYVILWPLIGWLPLTATRWLWAATAGLALVWLVRQLVRESGAATARQRWLVALTVLAFNATGVSVGNGQVVLHQLPAMIAAVLHLHRHPPGWRTDVTAALLFLPTLVKPNVAVPFFWLVLSGPRTWRAGALVVVGYGLLTALGASLTGVSPGGRGRRSWLQQLPHLVVQPGYANVHTWLRDLGWSELAAPASLVLLAALGLWVYRHRHDDVWHLLGVTALAARFWTYHRLYDDVLILLPMVALFRTATREAGPRAVLAGVLFAAALAAMLLPARLNYAPPPWAWPFTIGHPVVWVAVMIFLLVPSWPRRQREGMA
jgi:hypothetical protein